MEGILHIPALLDAAGREAQSSASPKKLHSSICSRSFLIHPAPQRGGTPFVLNQHFLARDGSHISNWGRMPEG
jgi:hypothetical protein